MIPLRTAKAFNKQLKVLRANSFIRLAHFLIAPLGVLGFFLSGGSLSLKEGGFVLLSFFVIDNLGLNTGFHKCLSHRAFKTHSFLQSLLSFLGLFAGQGSPLVWAAIHRSLHHPFADTNKDPHSPHKGFFHSFIAWYWRTGEIHLHSVKDLLQYPSLCFMHRYHVVILHFGFLLVTLVAGLKAVCILIFIPMILSLSLAGLVNSMLHTPDKNPFCDRVLLCYKNHQDTGDHSKNSGILGLLTAGLGYHNNHHRHPEKFDCGEKWWEWDLSAPIIRLIKIRS